MSLLNLFIDESGAANPKVVSSSCYILCGVLVPEKSRDSLKTKANQLKYKYWGKEDIVFHSREIGRREGDFRILKDETTRKGFVKVPCRRKVPTVRCSR